MPMQDLTAPPTPPSRDDPPDTFIERADAFLAWFPTFQSEMNTLVTQLEATAALIAVAPAYADPGLLALAGNTPAVDRLPYYDAVDGSALAVFTALARTLIAGSTQSSMQGTLGVYSTAQVDSAIAAAVTGLLDFKGSTDCSGNPNYPAASKGDAYVVSVAGKIGGASGVVVEAGDVYFATADNAGGAHGSVGTSWTVLEKNLAGTLLVANNLSDVADTTTARNNLSALGLISVSFGAGTISASITLSNGETLLIQGGISTLGANSGTNITFPTSYALAPAVVAGGGPSGTSAEGDVHISGTPTTTVAPIVNSSGNTATYTWFAIGKA